MMYLVGPVLERSAKAYASARSRSVATTRSLSLFNNLCCVSGSESLVGRIVGIGHQDESEHPVTNVDVICPHLS